MALYGASVEPVPLFGTAVTFLLDFVPSLVSIRYDTRIRPDRLVQYMGSSER
jgi:hypothetical protein